MPLEPTIDRWISDRYPRPKVDREWLEQCCNWLTVDEGLSVASDLPKIQKEIDTQLILSDLRDSMAPNTGFPVQASQPNFSGSIDGNPILVQITSITDVGISAFNLNQTRAAREERFKAGAVEDNAEDGDEEVDEGPVPKYSRGMLKFEVTDGTVALPAIEYKSLALFRLGETKLGTKLRLKAPLIRRGIIFLEPSSVELVGGMTDELEEQHNFVFKRDLFRRLGLPDPLPEAQNPQGPNQGQAAPERQNAERPPTALQSRQDPDNSSRPEAPPRTLQTQTQSQTQASSSTLVPSSDVSPYFPSAMTAVSQQSTAIQVSPHARPINMNYTSPQSPSPVPTGTKAKAKETQKDDSYEFDDMDMDMDEDAWNELDRLEKAAMVTDAGKTTVANMTVKTEVAGRSQSQAIVKAETSMTVIEIDDDEDEVKENVPVKRKPNGKTDAKRRGATPVTQSIAVVEISDSE